MRFIWSFICVVLTGCMVGPDFHPPALPNTNSYTESPEPTKTIAIPAAKSGGKAQHFIACQDIPAEWWHVFRSPELDNLIRAGLVNSPNLAAAKAVLMQAQQNFKAQVGTAFFPALDATFIPERQRFSGTTFGDPRAVSLFNLFDATVNVSYTLDVFGGARRGVEALCAQVNYEKFELEAAYLTLTANIVTTSITIASLREQIQATHELIRAQANQVNIVIKQFNLGGASKADVVLQQSQLGITQASLPPLEQTLAQSYHALSVLIGELPCEDRLPKFNLDALHLPTELPLSIPSLLVRKRPDIRASEALLHVASAQVGVATANLYPQITINGAYGWEGEVLSSLFNPLNKIWNIESTLTQPLFQGGALFAKRCAAIAAFNQAAAQYRETVLHAFQNVADTLRALEHDAQELKAQKYAEVAARQSLYLTLSQYRLGGVSYLNLLVAQRSYQQARIGAIQAQAARYADTAALFQALGGGWWNRRGYGC